MIVSIGQDLSRLKKIEHRFTPFLVSFPPYRLLKLAMTSYNVKAFTVVNLYSIRALQRAAEGRLYNVVFADTPSIRRIQCGERESVSVVSRPVSCSQANRRLRLPLYQPMVASDSMAGLSVRSMLYMHCIVYEWMQLCHWTSHLYKK